jgi:hypothetical protein
MAKSPPGTGLRLTRATRRALAAQQRKAHGKPAPMTEIKALNALYDAAVTGLVLDGDVADHPAEEGKIAFSAELDEASLRWNASWGEIDTMLAAAEHTLAALPESERRDTARATIISLLLSSRHLQIREGTVVAGLVTWLALTGPAGTLLRQQPTSHIGYLITRTGADEHNFRLIAG